MCVEKGTFESFEKRKMYNTEKNYDNIDTNTRVDPSITDSVVVERSYIVKIGIK